MAVVIGGCISIKSGETVVTQRAPGVATLGGTMCISDYDANHYAECQASNVQEVDNGCHPPTSGCFADGDDNSSPVSGQLLVAFRVPDGVTAPPSFLSDTQDTTFNFSQSYTDGMTAMFTKVAGEHWVGYVSGFKTVDPPNVPADRSFSLHAEFGLPAAPDGGPFAGPLKYRMAVGLRNLDDSTQSGDPVACDGSGTHLTFCADTPANTPPTFPADLTKNVSDFGVLAGSHATAGQGGTATVSFPLKYVDGGGLGAKDLALTASTTLPGASATPGATTIHMAPGATNAMNVTVTVPDAAPLGDYKVTLTAANGSPAVTRQNSGVITVADQVAPSIRISTPQSGAKFTFGQAVAADYGCTDQTNASGMKDCSGPVPNGGRIDTGSLGSKLFTVNASDNASNTASQTVQYTVGPNPVPSVALSFSFLGFPGKTTKLNLLVLKRIPRRSTVTVTCKAPRHKRCPVRKKFTKRNAPGTLKLKKFVTKSYPAGSTIEVRVTKTGSIGAVRVLTIRKNKAPVLSNRCLAPGAKTPKKC
jgi:hypothetical protein